jgi:hypothetical protein
VRECADSNVLTGMHRPSGAPLLIVQEMIAPGVAYAGKNKSGPISTNCRLLVVAAVVGVTGASYHFDRWQKRLFLSPLLLQWLSEGSANKNRFISQTSTILKLA